VPELKIIISAIALTEKHHQIWLKLLISICSIFYTNDYLSAQTTETKTLARQNSSGEVKEVEAVRSLLISQGVTRVTGVELQQSDAGLEVILRTVAGSQKLVPLILPVGNNLVIDILDATLALPDRKTFTAIEI
jgi:hypothetical protein